MGLANHGKLPLPIVGTEVWAALLHSCEATGQFLANKHGEMVSIKVSYRGVNDYLAIAKRYGSDGTLEVCFGSGTDFVASLLGLAVSLDQDKWRPDKYAR